MSKRKFVWHQCSWPGRKPCTEQIASDLILCPKHFYVLPPWLRESGIGTPKWLSDIRGWIIREFEEF